MAYTRKNYLKRVIKVQDIYLKYKEPHTTNRFILRKYVLPLYDMDESTFYKYLNIKNPRKQLERILQKEAKEKSQRA